MTLKTPLLSDQDRQTVQAAMPAIRRDSPDAAKVIARLVKAIAVASVAQTTPYASVAEAAQAFGVTPQTVRNWADRGWLPCERSFGGTRRIPRSALASAQALRRARPTVPDLSADQIDAIIGEPRRRT